MIPGIGTALSAYIALTGCDPVAGAPVNGLDRGFACIAALGPVMEALGNARECGTIFGCFAAGTPVLMADGTYQPIEQIKPGDWVQSANERTGQVEAKQVTATTAHPASQIVSVTLVDPRTRLSQTITCTPNHPFYVEGQGFTPAGSLGIGTSIVTRAGPTLAVSGLQFQAVTAGDTQVYNLTVDGDHTYFVGTGNGGAWVHNTCNSNTLSQEGIDQIANHLNSRGMNIEYNDAAIARLQGILDRGEEFAGYDKNFYEHELHESKLMSQGLEYDEAHAAAMKEYGVNDYDLYHPSIVSRFSGWFSPGYPRE